MAFSALIGRAVTIFLLALAVLTSAGSAQAPAPAGQAEPQFDVASIKPNNSGSGRSSSSMPPAGIYRAVNLSLQQILIDAFEVRAFQIAGAPDWSDRFDIQAKPPDNAAANQLPAMLRALLRERFGLVFHRESREQPVLLLMAARDDRRPAVTPSTCEGNACGMNSNINNGTGTMKCTGCTMPELATWLSNMVDRIVLDRTAMPGKYDCELRFSRDVPGVTPPPDSPSIVTAVREQLGLRLESGRGPVEFIVIDRVTRPTPD